LPETPLGKSKVNVNEAVPKFTADHAGKYVAVEWQDRLGWRRFLWCRR